MGYFGDMSYTPNSFEEVQQLYFEWLLSRMGIENYVLDTLRIASVELHQVSFVVDIPKDGNRLLEGAKLREEFEDEYTFGVRNRSYLNEKSVSLFEVLITLAEHMSDNMTDEDKPAGEFYEEMLQNTLIYANAHAISETRQPLLGEQYKNHIHSIAHNIMFRYYDKDGKGGFFPLKKPDKDQRKVELWYQMQAYLMENYYVDCDV